MIDQASVTLISGRPNHAIQIVVRFQAYLVEMAVDHRYRHVVQNSSRGGHPMAEPPLPRSQRDRLFASCDDAICNTIIQQDKSSHQQTLSDLVQRDRLFASCDDAICNTIIQQDKSSHQQTLSDLVQRDRLFALLWRCYLQQHHPARQVIFTNRLYL